MFVYILVSTWGLSSAPPGGFLQKFYNYEKTAKSADYGRNFRSFSFINVENLPEEQGEMSFYDSGKILKYSEAALYINMSCYLVLKRWG